MSNPQVVSVTPVEDVFSITWNISLRCNYDCMYCPPTLHNNHSKHLTLEQFKTYWQDIYNKTIHKGLKYKLSFTGGEVTSNKHFLPFLTWLRENYSNDIDKILISTNGSATYKYYQKMYNLVENISFSVHSEYIHETKFFNMIVKLKETIPSNKFIHVNIMNEYWNTERIVKYKEILAAHNISYSVPEVHLTRPVREFPIFKGKLDLEI